MTEDSEIEKIVKSGIMSFIKGEKIEEPVDKANEDEPPIEEPVADALSEEEMPKTAEEIPAEEEEVTREDLFKRCTGVSIDEASEDVLMSAIEDGLTALGL